MSLRAPLMSNTYAKKMSRRAWSIGQCQCQFASVVSTIAVTFVKRVMRWESVRPRKAGCRRFAPRFGLWQFSKAFGHGMNRQVAEEAEEAEDEYSFSRARRRAAFSSFDIPAHQPDFASLRFASAAASSADSGSGEGGSGAGLRRPKPS